MGGEKEREKMRIEKEKRERGERRVKQNLRRRGLVAEKTATHLLKQLSAIQSHQPNIY